MIIVVLVVFSCKTKHDEYNYLLKKEYIISSNSYSEKCEEAIKYFINVSNFFGENVEIKKIYQLKVELDTVVYDKSSPYYHHDEFCEFIGVIVKPVDEDIQLVTLVLQPNAGLMNYCSEYGNGKLYIVPSFSYYNDLSFVFKGNCFDKEKFQFSKIDSVKYGYWNYAGIKNFKGNYILNNRYKFDKNIYNNNWLFGSNKTLIIDTLKTSYKIQNDELILSNIDTFNIVLLSSTKLFLLDENKNVIYFKNNGR